MGLLAPPLPGIPCFHSNSSSPVLAIPFPLIRQDISQIRKELRQPGAAQFARACVWEEHATRDTPTGVCRHHHHISSPQRALQLIAGKVSSSPTAPRQPRGKQDSAKLMHCSYTATHWKRLHPRPIKFITTISSLQDFFHFLARLHTQQSLLYYQTPAAMTSRAKNNFPGCSFAEHVKTQRNIAFF